MLGPPSIEINPLLFGELERAFTLRIRQALPQGDGEFGPIRSWELQELGKWAGCHTPIVSQRTWSRKVA